MSYIDELSIIILNYNCYSDVIICIDTIINSGLCMNIIVVDNNSSDNSYDILREYYKGHSNISFILNQCNGGYSYGNNVGIKYAINNFHAQYIGVLNPDIIITDPDIFIEMCSALNRNEKLAIVGGSALNANKEFNPNNSGWNIPTTAELLRYHFLINDRKKKKVEWKIIDKNLAKVECVAGCFFVAKADILTELGFLDENVFLYNEENILGIKCKNQGYLEGILLDRFYIHNHKHNKNKEETLRKKITATKNVYESTKYLCRMYYSKWLIPILSIIEAFNRCYLFLAYIKNRIIKRVA